LQAALHEKPGGPALDPGRPIVQAVNDEGVRLRRRCYALAHSAGGPTKPEQEFCRSAAHAAPGESTSANERRRTELFNTGAGCAALVFSRIAYFSAL
jgi:hypothetical protein